MIARVRFLKSFFLAVLIVVGTTLAIGGEQETTSTASGSLNGRMAGRGSRHGQTGFGPGDPQQDPLAGSYRIGFPRRCPLQAMVRGGACRLPQGGSLLLLDSRGRRERLLRRSSRICSGAISQRHMRPAGVQIVAAAEWAASDHFIELLQASLMKGPSDGVAYREFVNDQEFLDYADAHLHKFAVSTHGEVRAHLASRGPRVNQSLRCRRSICSGSIDELVGRHFGQHPHRADGILDQDEGVRNSSTRLIGVFMGKLGNSTSVEPLVRTLCVQLGYTSFSDRDKAVNALLALADQHPSSRKTIRAGCEPLIRQRASDGESISPQIQGSAVNLLTLLSGSASSR